MAVELIWTVLPNGRSGGRLRATLFLSPRLTGIKTLGDDDLLRDWPRNLVDDQGNWKTGFRLHFSGGAEPVEAKPYLENDGPRRNHAPDTEVWAALLPPETLVRGYEFKDLSERRIHSFPERNLSAFVTERYRATAVTTPTALPATSELLRDSALVNTSLYKPIEVTAEGETVMFLSGGEVRDYAALSKQASSRLGRSVSPNELLMKDIRKHVYAETDELFKRNNAKAIAPGAPEPRSDFMRLKRFTLPRHLSRDDDDGKPPIEEKVKPVELDFHEIVSAYGGHPALLRMLGLAIDVEFEHVPAATGTVYLSIDNDALQTKAPRTHYVYNDGGLDALAFTARPRPEGGLDSCCLGVGRDEFSVMHMDVSGAGEKMMNLAVDIQRATVKKSADSKEHTALPALRTAGVSLVRTGAATALESSVMAQKQLNQKLQDNQEVEVWADDVLRGHRIDVLDGTSGQWRSLCRRRTTYSRQDNDQAWAEEHEGNDGWVSTAVTESTRDDEDDLYLQETMFRWNGWSLVAPRPGNSLSNDYKSMKQEGEAAQPLNLRIAVEVAKGTLPRLRYGFPYKLRARTVDLAGNGLTLEEANALTESQQGKHLVTGEGYTYLRQEPVAQPVLVTYNSLEGSNGESVEHLVIRSYNHSPELDRVDTDEVTQRHVLPTGTSELMAEQHGRFDDVDGHPLPAAYQTIVDHDHPLPETEGAAPAPSIKITYLPDPAVRGATFAGLPAGGGQLNQLTEYSSDGDAETRPLAADPATTVHQVDFGPLKSWPDLRSFRLRVQSAQEDRDPEWDSGQRVLTVHLRPGEKRKVRLSSCGYEQDLGKFEIWQWLKEQKQDQSLRERVLAGLHWMLTPFRELTFVHAVQQPLIAPEFAGLASHRKPHETWTTLADTIPVDGRSTLKIDVRAAWDDVSDSGARPRRINGRAYAFELPLEYEDTEARFGPEREFTRFRVNPRAMGVLDSSRLSSVREKPESRAALDKVQIKSLQKNETMKFERLQTTAATARSLTQTSSRVAQAVQVRGLGAMRSPASRRTLGRHEFGDTRYRRVTYRAIATTRYLEYMSFFGAFKAFRSAYREQLSSGKVKGDIVQQWEEQNPKLAFTRRSQPVTVDVLSAARPPAPEIEYVIPTFGWERSEGSGGVESRRSGGGLRVYLRRPWFASGDGELLGVVVAAPRRKAALQLLSRGGSPGSDALSPYVTQWGLDPIWRTAPTPTNWSPSLQDFRNTAATESGLTLDELDDAQVSVAGYPVGAWDEAGNLSGYDEERNLWFCDIEIDPGESYFPFVRLALARYQPNSLSGTRDNKPWDLKLSRVVMTDFAQLAPDRFASISFESETTARIAVTGHTYNESGADRSISGSNKLRIQGGSNASQTIKSARQPQVNVNIGEFARATLPRPEPGGSTLEASLETTDMDGAGSLAWRPVPDAVADLKRNDSRNTWQGTLTLPEPRGSRRYRIVIREYEWFVVDAPSRGAASDIRSNTQPRLVYADALEI